MRPSPTGSFLRFVIGFFVFISVSFGVTYLVQTISSQQQAEQQAAAAEALMLKTAQ